jgi:hypothetical protein
MDPFNIINSTLIYCSAGDRRGCVGFYGDLLCWIADVAACLAAIGRDPDAEVLRVKNRLDPG